MTERNRRQRFSRRDFIRAGTMAAGAAAIAPARPASAQPRSVPRNRTLTLVWSGSREGRWIDYELWNPYAIGSNHQNGPGILYEPLAYYSAFADKEYLWLAESYKYSPDFKELTIKTRSGIKWSDGNAVQRRRRGLHADQSQGAGAEGALGRRRAAVHAGGEDHRPQHRRHSSSRCPRPASSTS